MLCKSLSTNLQYRVHDRTVANYVPMCQRHGPENHGNCDTWQLDIWPGLGQ